MHETASGGAPRTADDAKAENLADAEDASRETAGGGPLQPASVPKADELAVEGAEIAEVECWTACPRPNAAAAADLTMETMLLSCSRMRTLEPERRHPEHGGGTQRSMLKIHWP